jgi:flagellar biosynthesis protein
MDKDTVTRQATALGQRDDGSAQVLAQGQGAQADKIEAMAKQHEVLVLQDFALSKRLSKVPVGTMIPDQVFQALASVLNFLVEEDTRFNRHPDTNRG